MFEKFKLRLGHKIFFSFLVLITLFVINALVIFFTANRIDNLVEYTSEVTRPSKDALNQLILTVNRSKMLSANWVFLQSNKEDKQSLIDLHHFDYPELKNNLYRLQVKWNDDTLQNSLNHALHSFDSLLYIENKEVMKVLVTSEDYENPLSNRIAVDAIEKKVIPLSENLITLIEELSLKQDEKSMKAEEELLYSMDQMRYTTVFMGIFIAIIALGSGYIMIVFITKPINEFKRTIRSLAKGKLVNNDKLIKGNDEIAEMDRAVSHLVNGLKRTAKFAEDIGKGNYSSDFNLLSDEDILGKSLLNMRESLRKASDEERKRTWSAEGFSLVDSILRNSDMNIVQLTDELLRNLIKYMNANQGAMYLKETEGEDEVMRLIGCYAWDRKKFIEQQFHLGEGMVGQVWQEGELIYMTEVPDDFIQITSGLGEANPRFIILTPIKVNNEVLGVLELASFVVFDKNQMDFLCKISENIGSIILNVKNNQKTKILLQESREMTEELRSQEEEMRQNMEELQATQEEMQRSQLEAASLLYAINSSILTCELTLEGFFKNLNDKYTKLLGCNKEDMLGQPYSSITDKQDKIASDISFLIDNLESKGIYKDDVVIIDSKDNRINITGTWTPIYNNYGEIKSVMFMGVDISEYKK